MADIAPYSFGVEQMATMKAVWFESSGNARDVLQYGEREKPIPAKGEVLIRLHSSAVNPSDVKARSGARPGVNDLPRNPS